MFKNFLICAMVFGLMVIAPVSLEMLFISSSNCDWCKRFDVEVLQDKEVQSIMGDITVRKLDINDPLAKKYNVRVVPNIIFMKDDRVVRQVIGYIPKDKFIAIVKEIQNEKSV
jgi:thioredoxin-related protein